MASLVSARVTFPEMIRIKGRSRAMGYQTIGLYIRNLLGLPPSEEVPELAGGLTEEDAVRLLGALLQHQKEIDDKLGRIIKYLNAPRVVEAASAPDDEWIDPQMPVTEGLNPHLGHLRPTAKKIAEADGFTLGGFPNGSF